MKLETNTDVTCLTCVYGDGEDTKAFQRICRIRSTVVPVVKGTHEWCGEGVTAKGEHRITFVPVPEKAVRKAPKKK